MMDQRTFRSEAIGWTDTGSSMALLVATIENQPTCDRTPPEIEVKVEEMIKHGLLTRREPDWITVSKSGWELWATSDLAERLLSEHGMDPPFREAVDPDWWLNQPHIPADDPRRRNNKRQRMRDLKEELRGLKAPKDDYPRRVLPPILLDKLSYKAEKAPPKWVIHDLSSCIPITFKEKPSRKKGVPPTRTYRIRGKRAGAQHDWLARFHSALVKSGRHWVLPGWSDGPLCPHCGLPLDQTELARFAEGVPCRGRPSPKAVFDQFIEHGSQHLLKHGTYTDEVGNPAGDWASVDLNTSHSLRFWKVDGTWGLFVFDDHADRATPFAETTEELRELASLSWVALTRAVSRKKEDRLREDRLGHPFVEGFIPTEGVFWGKGS